MVIDMTFHLRGGRFDPLTTQIVVLKKKNTVILLVSLTNLLLTAELKILPFYSEVDSISSNLQLLCDVLNNMICSYRKSQLLF